MKKENQKNKPTNKDGNPCTTDERKWIMDKNNLQSNTLQSPTPRVDSSTNSRNGALYFPINNDVQKVVNNDDKVLLQTAT